MAHMLGHILEEIGQGGILGGIGKSLLDDGKPKMIRGPGDKSKAPSYKNGTDYVPKTGPADLHQGEAVLKKKDAKKYRAGKGEMSIYDLAQHHMGGGEHKKHKKEIKEIRTRKGKSGGFIHEHHHTHPEDHPMEEHTSADSDAMADHMMEHMGQPDQNGENAAQPSPAPTAAPAMAAMAAQ